MTLLDTIQQHVSQNLLLIAAAGYTWYRLRAWLRADEEKRSSDLDGRIHKGVVAALNNGGAEPVRRLLREEVGDILRRHEERQAKRMDDLEARLALVERRRR